MPQTTDKRAKSRQWMPVVIACAVLIGGAMWASALLPLGNKESTQAQRGATPSTTATTVAQYPRFLKEWNGQVALFLPDDSEPQTVYEVNVLALPEEEQQLLNDGIVVESEEELAAILENYTS